MAQTSNEAILRAVLHTKMNAGWTTLTQILDDPQFDTLPKVAATVPYGAIDFADDPTGEFGGLKFDLFRYRFGLLGVFARPTSGTIKAAQTTNINLLMAQLTATPHVDPIVRDQRFAFSYQNLFAPEEPVYSCGVLADFTVIESIS